MSNIEKQLQEIELTSETERKKMGLIMKKQRELTLEFEPILESNISDLDSDTGILLGDFIEFYITGNSYETIAKEFFGSKKHINKVERTLKLFDITIKDGI